MTKQQIIQRYISLNISLKKWKPGFLLPSENQLANKFKCSRFTVRNALLAYVYSGVITSIKGKGYIITIGHGANIFKSIGSKVDSIKNEVEIIDIESVPETLVNFFNVNNFENTTCYSFKKSYFDDKNKLIAYQLSFLNKYEVIQPNWEQIKKSLWEFLHTYGIIPTTVHEHIEFGRNELLDKKAKELEFEGEYPIEYSALFTNNKWIEIAIRIYRKDKFKFNKVTKLST